MRGNNHAAASTLAYKNDPFTFCPTYCAINPRKFICIVFCTSPIHRYELCRDTVYAPAIKEWPTYNVITITKPRNVYDMEITHLHIVYMAAAATIRT